MDKHITKKQLEILILLYRYRFLNRIQIQTLLNHKDYKRINTWLKDLTKKEIIGRQYGNKVPGNNKPVIYYLSSKSKTILNNKPEVDNEILKRVYSEKNRSQKFVNHCLGVADFYLNLKRNYTFQKIFFYTKTDLSKYDYLPVNHPDAYVAIKNGKKIGRYFFEIIDEGTPKFAIRSKINQYIKYYDTNTWKQVTKHPFPKILILCPNDLIKKFLHSYIQKTMMKEYRQGIDFYLSTKPDIRWTNAFKK